MIKKTNQEIPSNSLSYVLICGGIIILISLLGIIPFYQYNANRSQAVKNIQDQINEKQELGQVYLLIQKASGKKEIHALPNPAKTRLSRQDVDRFQDTFRTVAGESGLTTISLIPDVKTMASGSQNLLYNATIQGEFTNFHKLLVKLGALSYIDQIEEINIKQDSDSMEFGLKIWIALAN